MSYTDLYWYCNDCWARRGTSNYGQHYPYGQPSALPALPPSHDHYDPYRFTGNGSTHERLCEDRCDYDESSSEVSTENRRPRKRSRKEQQIMYKEAARSTTEPTTLMLRNLPKTLTRDLLMDLLHEEGFGMTINIIYVPMNFRVTENFGYGFINLTTFQEAEKCRAHFQGFTRWPVPSEQECDVRNGDTCQGVEALVERYRNSPVMHESMPECHKPAMFQNGVRVPFPAPTRNLKRPRIKQRKPKGANAAKEPEDTNLEQPGLGIE